MTKAIEAPVAGEARARRPGIWSSPRTWIIAAGLAYIASLAVTHAAFAGDTRYYVGDVAAVLSGAAPQAKLWEFGHLLWRPLAFWAAPAVLAAIPDGMAWTPALKLTFFLHCVNQICGLAVVLLLAHLLCKVTARAGGRAVPLAILIWGAAFLSYSQSGAPYVVSLALLVLAIWWPAAGPGGAALRSIAGGLAAAAATLFWFPFVLAVPAAVCAPLFLEPRSKESRWRMPLLGAVAAGVTIALGLAAGALLAGCRSAADVLQWYQAASHGWEQSRRILRAVSGCARLLVDFGNAAVSLKRYLFHDPYAAVSLIDIARGMLWQIGLFWALAGSALLAASRSAAGRRMLLWFSIAGIPYLVFAIFIFEPSSPERFLPALPLFLLTLAAAWESDGPAGRCARGVAILFALLLPVMNGPSMLRFAGGDTGSVRERLREFRRAAAPSDVLMTVLQTDPLAGYPVVAPFDEVNRPGTVATAYFVWVASKEAARWRESFSAQVLRAWSEGRDVWLVKGALAARPPASLNWVEGDDPNVRWAEIPVFTRSLEYDRETPSAEGFRRIARSARTRAVLEGAGR